METVNEILRLITNYGFPVVMCLLVWKQNAEQDKKFTELVKSTTEAITANSAALNRLTEAIKSREV